MKKKTATIMSLLMVVGLMALMSCSENPITGNTFEPMMKEAIPSSEIAWLNWKPEALAALSSREKGEQEKEIDEDGGKVGGGKTLHNLVKFPEGAMDFEQDITVRVMHVENNKQTDAGVEFLPSQQFNCDVKIVLSYAYLDVPKGSDPGIDFTPYFSEDGGETWYGLTNYSVDFEKQKITIWVDHFTRYAWGL